MDELKLGEKDPDLCQYGDCKEKRVLFSYGCPVHNPTHKKLDIKGRIDMAKFKHNEQTLHVLNDLDNRLTQLIEAVEATNNDSTEIRALQSARTLVDQCRTTGHVFRGNDFFPDGLADYYDTAPYENPLKVETTPPPTI